MLGQELGQGLGQEPDHGREAAPATRRPRGRPAPIPAIVVTGFLGAGKTTLLNEWAQAGALKDTVVLINEFGEIPIDHLLVERIDGDMLLLASGCLCCTIRGDLVSALENLLRRLDNGRIAPFARLIIETTGLADPVPVLQTLCGHPYFALRFRLDGLITLVDAANGAATLARHREARRQAATADRIVLTKTDLAPEAAPALRDALAVLNPTAPVLDRARGEADAEALLRPSRTPEAGLWMDAIGHAQEIGRAQENGHAHEHSHAHEHGHEHGHAHDRNAHDETIRAFCLTHDAPIAPAALDLFLRLLQTAHGPRLLRAKGLVALDDDPARPLVIHAAQHVLHPPVRLSAWPGGDRRTRIVLIFDGVDQAGVESLFASVCGDIAPDRADLAALRANPLDPRPAGLLG